MTLAWRNRDENARAIYQSGTEAESCHPASDGLSPGNRTGHELVVSQEPPLCVIRTCSKEQFGSVSRNRSSHTTGILKLALLQAFVNSCCYASFVVFVVLISC